MTRLRIFGRLLRLSLSATAVADVAAGVVLGAGGWPGGPAPWALILASLAVYHGGMVLNDWADRAHDARTRPERPLPSGAVLPGAALGLALALLVLGPALAASVDLRAGAALGLAALFAATYDLAPRHAWLGPALLGLCRALNLGAGLLFGLGARPGGRGLEALVLFVPLAYGLYVFLVSRLGRLEDREDDLAARRVHPRWLVTAAALVLFAPALVAGALPGDRPALRVGLGALVAACGAVGLLRHAWRAQEWTPALVGRTMGMALRRLLVFTACVALAGNGRAGLLVALLILAGYPVSHALRRVFPPS